MKKINPCPLPLCSDWNDNGNGQGNGYADMVTDTILATDMD